MSGSPDGEVTNEVSVNVWPQGPLPRHPVGRSRLFGFVGDALDEFVDQVGEPVEVTADFRLLP